LLLELELLVGKLGAHRLGGRLGRLEVGELVGALRLALVRGRLEAENRLGELLVVLGLQLRLGAAHDVVVVDGVVHLVAVTHGGESRQTLVFEQLLDRRVGERSDSLERSILRSRNV
jgi:hypothetical protein